MTIETNQDPRPCDEAVRNASCLFADLRATWWLWAVACLCCCSCASVPELEVDSPPLLPPLRAVSPPEIRVVDGGLFDEGTDASDRPPRFDLHLTSEIDDDESGQLAWEASAPLRMATCACCSPPVPSARGPRDEYVCDGGDAGLSARVRSNRKVDGIQLEDTIAHFDTLDGDIEIVASNQACVYAPRFAVVRSVVSTHQSQMNDLAINASELVAPNLKTLTDEAAAVKQPVATVRAVGTSIGTTLESQQRGLLASDVDQPVATSNKALPFENLQVIEFGVLANEDLPILLEGAAAAGVWSAVETAQVVIDETVAIEQKAVSQAQAEVVYELPRGKPRLRLIKLASRADATSGDVVEFTIRFDNVGVEPIRNVTIIDKLSRRLGYVELTATCSRPAQFTADDSGDSLELRWQVAESLEPGQGGIIRFDCRVR